MAWYWIDEVENLIFWIVRAVLPGLVSIDSFA